MLPVSKELRICLLSFDSLICMCARTGGHFGRDARSSSRHFLGVMNEQATSFWMSSERNDTLV
jgi:hypothetical protein